MISDHIIGKQVKQTPKLLEYVDNYFTISIHSNVQLLSGTSLFLQVGGVTKASPGLVNLEFQGLVYKL